MSTNKLHNLNILRGHTEEVLGFINLDSRVILSWSNDTTLRIWHLDQINSTTILRGHNAQVTYALNLPGGLISSTAYDGSLCIWKSETGTLMQKIIRPELSFMGTMYYQPNQIISWDLEGNLILWDVSTGEAVSTVEGACFRYSEASMMRPFLLLRERSIAVTWPSITLEFWDLQTGQCIHSAMEHDDGVESACLLPNDSILTWSNDHTLKIWTPEGTVEATLKGHENTIRNAYVIDDNHIVSWSSDATVRIWNFLTAEIKCVFTQHSNPVRYVWPVSNNLILSQSLDGRCYVWDRETGQSITTFTTEVRGGLVMSESKFLNWTQATIKLWDLDSGECIQVLNEHEGDILGAKLVDAKTVVSWSKDSTLRVWELAM